MKFFLPYAKDDKLAEESWEAIRKFTGENTGWEISSRRVFSITYKHDGKEYYAEVGKLDPREREEVIAILDSNTYLICTPNRGVLRGIPILVGKNEAISVIDFE